VEEHHGGTDEGAQRPWVRVAGTVREHIAVGELRPGDQLPTIRTFAAEFGTKPMTVQRAFRELADDGTLRHERGGPYYVSEEARTGRARRGML
jgi:DNA-binding transcriptional regulator YhcF (GntR family)